MSDLRQTALKSTSESKIYVLSNTQTKCHQLDCRPSLNQAFIFSLFVSTYENIWFVISLLKPLGIISPPLIMSFYKGLLCRFYREALRMPSRESSHFCNYFMHLRSFQRVSKRNSWETSLQNHCVPSAYCLFHEFNLIVPLAIPVLCGMWDLCWYIFFHFSHQWMLENETDMQ